MTNSLNIYLAITHRNINKYAYIIFYLNKVLLIIKQLYKNYRNIKRRSKYLCHIIF